MRFILPAILIAIALSVFFIFVMPTYGELASLRSEVAAYNEALGNSKALENERDKLVAKYNSLNREDLARLEKLLPQNVDNIRLILEIEQLATPYGMAIRNVKYKSDNTAESVLGLQGGAPRQPLKDYGILEMEFTTSGAYADFLKFLSDLENNLRLVDITSINFSSEMGQITDQSPKVSPDTYEYNVKIKTYWLKN